jgi:uncharacterized membrane protein YgaE (UPF0421/DUF939 family)
MSQGQSAVSSNLNRLTLEHLARTTVAAMVALYLANLFKLPNAYWAAITTLIVMQSTLGDTLTISGQRFVGTALGAAAGALLAAYFGPSVIVFGIGVFVIGIICAALRLGRAASALAGVTLALVVLVERTEPPWKLAAHRFVEVSLGIVVALILAVLWPQRPANSPSVPDTSASHQEIKR